MKHHIPDEIKKNSFACFTSLNQAERAVVMFGDERYDKDLFRNAEGDIVPAYRQILDKLQPLAIQ